MRKAHASIVLLGVVVLAVLVLGPSCGAEEPPAKTDSTTQAASTEGAAIIEASAAKVKIHIQRRQQNIFVTPPNVVICFESDCDGDGFRWEIVGGLEKGETLTISDAPGHPKCFPETVPVAIQSPNNGAESGPPDESCMEDKYGTYWPYLIEMELADGTTFSTDPGGIIHKRR